MRKFNVLAVLLLITLLVTGCVASSQSTESNPKSLGDLYNVGLEYAAEDGQRIEWNELPDEVLERWSGGCAEIAELLARGDYGEAVYRHYMDTFGNTQSGVTVGYTDEVSDAAERMLRRMDFDEMLLSQDAAYDGLSDSERREILDTIVYKSVKRKNEKWGTYYLSQFYNSIACHGTQSKWYELLKNSEYTGDAKEIADNVIQRCEQFETFMSMECDVSDDTVTLYRNAQFKYMVSPYTIMLYDTGDAMLDTIIQTIPEAKDLSETADYPRVLYEHYMHTDVPLKDDGYYASKAMEFDEVMLATDAVCVALSDEEKDALIQKMNDNVILRNDGEHYPCKNGFFAYIEWAGEKSNWNKYMKK